jgi:DNA-binding transcriptional MerR regulator
MRPMLEQVVPEVNMLRIGEFSRLSQVTIKALRYYDDMNLLKPAHIDKFTGYRYYSVDQLQRIHRIVAFKELGLSLEQIANVLHDNLSSEHIREILRMQEAEIKQRIAAEQARLAQVEFRLRMIDMEDHMPDLEVIVKPIAPLRALTLRTSISIDYQSMIAFQAEIEQAMTQYHFRLDSPLTEIHYADEFQMDYQDVEFVFPVDESQTQDVPLETAGTLELKTVPGLALAASYIHRGYDSEHISDALAVLQRWIVANPYELRGEHRIVHHRGPLQHAEYPDWIMEFQHEIAPLDSTG